MHKEKFCKDLVIGEAFEKEPFVLQFIGNKKNGQIRVTLADRSGTVQCDIAEALAEEAGLIHHIGEVFSVSAVIMADKRLPLLVATAIKLCPDDYLPAELYSGLSQEKKEEYIQIIRTNIIPKITNLSYIALINACLTDENLERLGQLPATHNDYGVYLGGALAATCAVTSMVMSSMASYVYKGNGITTKAPKWNVLVTAALLHAFGRIDYCDPVDPFKKTARGVSMNYFSTLQHSIETVIYKNNISISENDIALLLNVLAVAVSKRTEICAVSKDGSILRNILRLYAECDAYDYHMANYAPQENEEYFYARKLHRYLLTTEDN